MLNRILSAFKRPAPPPTVEVQLSQMEHSALQFRQWWAVRSETGSLRGPRQPLAAEAYAAGAASVYALAESLGVTLYPPPPQSADLNAVAEEPL